MIRTVLYLRFSSDNQREESIEGQRRECMAYAKHTGLDVVDEYVDRAFSAKTDDRPDFQRMIRDSYSHKFDAVLVWKLDRFARSKFDSVKYKTVLKHNNVKVISATEALGEGKESIILTSVIEAMDEYYVLDLKEKVTRGMTENALEGKFNGGPIPFGFKKADDSRLIINEDEAAIVRMIFSTYLNEQQSIPKLIRYLNERGITRRGASWSDAGMRRFLKNPIYIGEIHFMNVVTKDKFPAIVDKDIFNKVQEKLKTNRKKSASFKAEDKYLLSYKLYFGDCGGLMVGECTLKKKTGKIYRYYKCQHTKRGHSCKMPSVPKEPLEEAVLKDIKETINDSDLMDQIIYEAYKSQDKETPLMKSLNKDLKETQKRLNNVLNAFENGFGNDELNTRLKELSARKDELIKAINEEAIENPYLELDEVAALFARFRQLDIDQIMDRQALVDAFIDRIIYYEDGSYDIYFTTKGISKKHRKINKNPDSNGGSNNSGTGSNIAPSGSPFLYLCLILRYRTFFVKIINSYLFFEM